MVEEKPERYNETKGSHIWNPAKEKSKYRKSAYMQTNVVDVGAAKGIVAQSKEVSTEKCWDI